MISSSVEFVHTADFKIDFFDHPKLQIFSKVQDTKFINDMEMVGSVEVEDRVECQRISVKVNFVVSQRVSIHKFEDVLMSPGLGQHAQPGQWPLLQHPPHDLMSHSANIDHNLGILLLVSGNGGWIWRFMMFLILGCWSC